MAPSSRDPWNTSYSVPHFTPLKSAEYLTDPAVIRAYNKLCDPPEDQLRFIRRISRNLHFNIWIRSVLWCCSLVFATGIAFATIVHMDFRMKSLIFPSAVVDAEDDADESSRTMAIQAKSEERVTATDGGPTVR